MERLIYSVLFFTLMLCLLYVSKSKFIFDDKGELKAYGIKSNQTLFSFGAICVVLAFTSIFLFTFIEVVLYEDSRHI